MSVAFAIKASIPTSSPSFANALLSLGKHGPPNPKPGRIYLFPILESVPTALSTTSGSALHLDAISPTMLAKLIFVVRKQFTESLVISASVLDILL